MYSITFTGNEKIIRKIKAERQVQAEDYRQMCKCLRSFLFVLLGQGGVPEARVYPKAARYFSGKQSCIPDQHEPHIPPQTEADRGQLGFSTMCKFSIKTHKQATRACPFKREQRESQDN